MKASASALRFAGFVTGTDTDVGKTLVAAALLELCRARGWKSVGMKPVAAGCASVAGEGGKDKVSEPLNADVAALMAAGNCPAPAYLVNPYCFEAAIAPHIAAAQAGVRIDPAVIVERFHELVAATGAEAVVVEGAGGFLVPLDAQHDMGDLAQCLDLPLILVVGMRLGCLNHALLTQQAIAARGLRLAGWVANRIDPQMANFAENLATLRQRLPAPLLGVLPYLPGADPGTAAGYLRLPDRDCESAIHDEY